MTDIWKFKNGNYLRRAKNEYVEFGPEGGLVNFYKAVPEDAVPMVPATGRRVTGEELFDAWENCFSAFSRQAEYEQRAWNSAAERLNLRVREPERQPWDVLREAADILPDYALRLRERADNLEAAAKEKAQRDREIAAVQQALDDVGITTVAAERVVEYLDAVRGEQA